MATIEIERAHALTQEQAKAKAEELARSMEEKLGLVWAWEGEQIKFDSRSGVAKGAKGFVRVTGANVRVEVDLPFMLRPMKGTVESRINDKLKELMG